MQSLTSWGYISPPTPEKLDRIREFYDTNYKSKSSHLSPLLASKLLALLLSLSGDVDDRSSSLLSGRQPSELARAALALFVHVLPLDLAFVHAVEQMESAELLARLKLKHHLRARKFRISQFSAASAAEHRALAQQCVQLLGNIVPKLAAPLDELSSQVELAPMSGLSRQSLARFAEAAPGRLPPAGLYYDTPGATLVDLFRTNAAIGLALESDVGARRERFGRNELPRAKPPSIPILILRQFKDFIIIILLVVAILSLAFEDWIEAGVLFAVILANAVIGFWQEFKAERALRALQSLERPRARVRRGAAEPEERDAAELVPGDICVLEEGDAVPADLRLLEVAGLHVIEALLTGESEPLAKQTAALPQRGLGIGDRTNMAFMNTAVAKGRAVGIVVATGSDTEVGKISAALLRPDNSRTLLQQRLSRLGKWLVVLSVVLCALIVAIGIIRVYVANDEVTGDDWLRWVKVGVSLAVSVIPEGLVAVTTVTMAAGVQRMAAKHAIVRRLAAVETIGALTTICSDKTGTLTEGRMTATKLWLPPAAGVDGDVAATLTLDGSLPDDAAQRASFERAMLVASVCNHASLGVDGEPNKGDPTEVALLVAAEAAGVGRHKWRRYAQVSEAPFDSDRKRMSVLVRRAGAKKPKKRGGERLGDKPLLCLLCKGAVEAVVQRCDRALVDGKLAPLKKALVRRIEERNAALAGGGLRVLAFAYRRVPDDFGVDDVDDDAIERRTLALENEHLVFVGLVGIIDPPRASSRATVQLCLRAGLRVCMITGDHHKTALAIATQLGICDASAQEGKQVLTGQQLDSMAIDDLEAMSEFPVVFARVSPANKLLIVDALRARGELCAMTGDGVNDAPAIKHANVGIAMGRTATDMTKQAAAVILTDDNFGTIADAVAEGRRINDNIIKFVLYLLACNGAEIYSMLGAVVFGLPVPMSPIMILWANLIADVFAALALGIDPAAPDVMERPPRDPKRGIFTLTSLAQLLMYGFSMAAIQLGVVGFIGEVQGRTIDPDPEVASPGRGIAFITLTMAQLAHAFVVHTDDFLLSRALWSNLYLVGAVLLSVTCLVAACYIPGVNTVLQQHALDGSDWAIVVVGVAAHLIVAETIKFVLRMIRRRQTAIGN
jgi:Ca2+-transporting ATPase